MNIGKIICLLLIIPLCCGCNEHETSSAPSFRQCFIEVYYSGGLELPMLQTGYFGTQPTVPPQNLQTGFVITPNYSHNNMCDSFSDPEEFLRLATRNDDTSFNQWVPDHLCLRTPAFANNFRELHVVSNADWDEEHPAGSLLDDILLVRLYSYANMKMNIYDQAVLEGVATSFPQTEEIIENGKVSGITATDVQKILNLKHAWEFILDRDVVASRSDYYMLSHIARIVNEGFFAE